MIYTRLGMLVEIVGRHPDYEKSGWVCCRFLEDQQGDIRSLHICELFADGGIEEIHDAAVHSPGRAGDGVPPH
jgi:hypothetical protein